jgi:hypothetical protein
MTAILVHNVKQHNTQHNSFPRRNCARGLQLFHPVRGGRSADRRPVLARHRLARRVTQDNERIMRARLCHAAGRGACEAPRVPQSRRDARLSALHVQNAYNIDIT